MKRIIYFAAAALALASCGNMKAGRLSDVSENVQVECAPRVLSNLNDTVRAQVRITYPAGYFSKDARLVVSPFVVYQGGEMALPPLLYQGENVMDNNKVVSSEGGTVTENIMFRFLPGMEKCRLELRSKAVLGERIMQMPVIKVADGCINLLKWAEKSGAYSYKSDNYKPYTITTAEGQILYDVNSASVKGSELSTGSIKTLQAAIAEGQEDSRVRVKGTKIISYASPEGGEELNEKLSQERSESAKKAWKSIGKDIENTATEVQSIGQDWEGFKDAVQNSELEDKDLILRVLSMYSDPAVRESEIRNLSQVFTELKDKVFPELRRSRFITEMEYQNYSESDLKKLLDRKRLYLLDEEGLLRLASLIDSLDLKQMLYRAAADRMGSERARYNLGITQLEKGSPLVAEVYFDRLRDRSDKDLLNVLGVIALQKGEFSKAGDYFAQSGTDDAKQNIGLLHLLKGDFAAAKEALAGSVSRNEAIACIGSGDYSKALEILKDHSCPVSYYLRAIASARLGDAAAVRENLIYAAAKAPALAEAAKKDIEFEGFDF